MRNIARCVAGILVLCCGPACFAAGSPDRRQDKEQLNLALMLAAHKGTVQDVRAALAAGGDPNAAHFGPGGMTPLMYAVADNNDAGVIAALLQAGAKVETRRADGDSVLHLAVEHDRSLALVNALLAAAARLPKKARTALLNARDRYGRTALLKTVWYTSQSPEHLVAEALFLAGADGSVKDGVGACAFDFVEHNPSYRDSPLFAAASGYTEKESKARDEALRRKAGEKAAKGEPAAAEPSEEGGTEQDGSAPGADDDEEEDEAAFFAGKPGLLSKEIMAIEPLRENAGIDLGRYHVANPGAELPALGEPARFSLFSKAEMPVLDGALASFPLYSAFARACYAGLGAPSIEKWADYLDEDGKWDMREEEPVTYHNARYGFERLLGKTVDIFFGVAPSAERVAEAAKRGRALVFTPLDRDAFVFFTHKDNPVNNLTREQIKAIYAGTITNWKEVGGPDQPILAFQRNKGSGSQAAMERFMGAGGAAPLAKPPLELSSSEMEGIILAVAGYRSVPGALGFTFLFFAERLAANDNVKLLSVDGVAPSLAGIRDHSYPIPETRFAITLKENKNPAVARFLEWMQGTQGQSIVKAMGYAGND
jgi:phosphate transport system substrate-binding protein